MIDATFEQIHADYLRRGYRDVTEHRGLRVGARVLHIGHQWRGAELGTGTVRAVMRRHPSEWTQRTRRPDVEVIVEYDRRDGYGPLDGRLHGIADYHVVLATARLGLHGGVEPFAYAAKRDASWFSHPDTRAATVYHVDCGGERAGTAACSWRRPLAEFTRVQVGMVPEHLRCQGSGCKRHWPQPYDAEKSVFAVATTSERSSQP